MVTVGKDELQLTRNVILWLSDIHPEALHIIRVELVISSNCGEDLLFDRSWSELFVSFSLDQTSRSSPQCGQGPWGGRGRYRR
jgi:hypothetical protein